MVYLRIIYGIIIYGACASSLLKKVQTLQNKLLKVLFKLPPRTDSNILHFDLEILKVHDIYKYQIHKFVYESIKEHSIKQFHNYYTMNYNIHQINTRQQNQIHRSITKTQYGLNSLKVYGARLWNSLPIEFQQSKSLATFKKAVRQSMINTYNI